MAKFSINSTVRYNGQNNLFKGHFTNLKVIDIIPDGLPIGNGEVNRSGMTIYRVQAQSGVIFNFLESELCV